MRALQTFTIVLATSLAVAASAQAGPISPQDQRVRLNAPLDVILPAEWAGIWNIDTQTYICEPEELLTSASYLDTLCTDSTVDFDFGSEEITLTCNGSADGNTMTVECTGSGEVFPGCTAAYAVVSSATRTGDTYESTTTITTTYEGAECAFLPPSCMRIEAVGTRIAPPPSPCTLAPAEAMPWGSVKAMYR